MQICSRKATHCARCCQNAPVAIHHIINYINSYVCRELFFGSYFTYFHNKYQRNSVSLCPYFCYVLVTLHLYFENCPRFIWNCPWFMPNPNEPGAILKYKSALVPTGLFQGLLTTIINGRMHTLKVLFPIHSLIPQLFSNIRRFWYQKLSHI